MKTKIFAIFFNMILCCLLYSQINNINDLDKTKEKEEKDEEEDTEEYNYLDLEFYDKEEKIPRDYREILLKIAEENLEIISQSTQKTTYTNIPNLPPSSRLLDTILADPTSKVHIGDKFNLTISNPEPTNFSSIVNSNYTITFPYIGKFNAKNKTILVLQNEIIEKTQSIFPKSFIDCNLISASVFPVFLHGYVYMSGQYNIYPIERIIDIIAHGEGVTEAGSIRSIQLTRNNAKYEIDLYQYFTGKDLSVNMKVEPDDIIFIPQASRLIHIKGEVNYPGTYELLENESFTDLINYAGGFTPFANKTECVITNFINKEIQYNNKYYDISEENKYNQINLKNYDEINISHIDTLQKNVVYINTDELGLKKFHLYENEKILGLLQRTSGIPLSADLENAFLERYIEGKYKRIELDLYSVMIKKDYSKNILIKNNDIITIPILVNSILVKGSVLNPGEVNFISGRSAKYYIHKTGGPLPEVGHESIIRIASADGNTRWATYNTKVDIGDIIIIPPSGKNRYLEVLDIVGKTQTSFIAILGIIGVINTILGDTRTFRNNVRKISDGTYF